MSAISVHACFGLSAFRVKLGGNDLNCVDVPLNPTRSLHSYNCMSVDACIYLKV